MKVKHYVERLLEEGDTHKMDKLTEILLYAVKELKESDKKAYEEVEEELYVLAYGYTLSDSLCEKWVKGMKNKDGTKGKHWTVEETSQVARQMNIPMVNFTEYEWWATMNMMYSDYYGAIPNDVTTYARMSRCFLEDEDAKEGKLYHYYKCIVD